MNAPNVVIIVCLCWLLVSAWKDIDTLRAELAAQAAQAAQVPKTVFVERKRACTLRDYFTIMPSKETRE
jgi:cell division protein FtsB